MIGWDFKSFKPHPFLTTHEMRARRPDDSIFLCFPHRLYARHSILSTAVSPYPGKRQRWGKGFTEWSNVVKAKPLFRGHCQPLDSMIVHFYERDAVAFQVTDTLDGDSARGKYAGHLPGIVRPLLRWQPISVQQSKEFSACDAMRLHQAISPCMK